MSNIVETEQTPLPAVRNRLARIWFIGSGLIFLLLLVQTLIGRLYSDAELKAVWSWFLPTVVPTLSSIIGVMGGTALNEPDKHTVSRDFSALTSWLSASYLATVALVFLVKPISHKSQTDLLDSSHYWLPEVQGLVVGAIGVLFTSKQRAKTMPRKQADVDEHVE